MPDPIHAERVRRNREDWTSLKAKELCETTRRGGVIAACICTTAQITLRAAWDFGLEEAAMEADKWAETKAVSGDQAKAFAYFTNHTAQRIAAHIRLRKTDAAAASLIESLPIAPEEGGDG